MKFHGGVDPSVPYYVRLREEADVIAFQVWRMVGVPLLTEPNLLPGDASMRARWNADVGLATDLLIG